MKVKHLQSRTVQVKQYEPHLISYEVEEEFDSSVMDAEIVMEAMKNTVSKKLEADITSLIKEKENSK